jgi:hypothetical protein
MSDETLARKSREDRFRLQQQVDAGLSEEQALLKLFPKDSNRARKLKTWRDKGLFPIPESERPEHNTTVNTTATTEPESVPATPQTPLPSETTDTTVADTVVEPSSADERQTVVPVVFDLTHLDSEDERQLKLWKMIDDRVARILEERLKALTAGFHVSEKPPGGPGKYYTGGKTHTKINVSIPTELNEALERLGGVKSNHVSNAIKLYLGVSNSSADTT